MVIFARNGKRTRVGGTGCEVRSGVTELAVMKATLSNIDTLELPLKVQLLGQTLLLRL